MVEEFFDSNRLPSRGASLKCSWALDEAIYGLNWQDYCGTFGIAEASKSVGEAARVLAVSTGTSNDFGNGFLIRAGQTATWVAFLDPQCLCRRPKGRRWPYWSAQSQRYVQQSAFFRSSHRVTLVAHKRSSHSSHSSIAA